MCVNRLGDCRRGSLWMLQQEQVAAVLERLQAKAESPSKGTQISLACHLGLVSVDDRSRNAELLPQTG